jgi:fructokinase
LSIRRLQFACAAAVADCKSAKKGERRGGRDCNIFQDRLARSLASVINILDPDVIVLGGGLSNVLKLYSSLRTLVQSHTFSDAVNTPIVRPRYGDSSGVRGAAWLWQVASRA